LRHFRNHGIATDSRQREEKASWFYEMIELGFNYRLTDIQCALGISQLKKLPDFLNRRRQIAARYDAAFQSHDHIRPLTVRSDVAHAYHLYVVRVPDRDRLFSRLRNAGIGVNVHYIPVYMHPYYQRTLTSHSPCSVAESAYETVLSLPIYPSMSDSQQNMVIKSIINLS
ncbi:MAG: DegT/DnrJ/EryC1/StrS family aminotransferase, partial [Desulfamplus sp.]|nr:DegT/DnrJ/EryC1/StrS family aminotransferase [Desulfamplus sp.]